MIDRSRAKAPRGTLPDFAPVPRQCNRHDGWTPDRQRDFIEALADTGSVKAAARMVNMTPEGAYLLRRHPQAHEFRKAWEAALKLGVQRLEDVAMERALHGIEVPVYHFGAVVGSRRVYNDRLLMFLLRNRATKRFAADALHKADAYTRQQLEKLKRQWHEEWENERREAEARDSEEIIQSINRKLGLMHDRKQAAMSERTRELYEAYRASEAADQGLPSPDDYEDDDDEEEDGELE